jgi:hypothetical protein
MKSKTHLYLKTPKEMSKSRSSAVKNYAVDDYYKIYFELVAKCGIGEKSEVRYNTDETELHWNNKPPKILGRKGRT